MLDGLLVLALAALASAAGASDRHPAEIGSITQESIHAVQASRSQDLTPALVVAKVTAACRLIDLEGSAAVPRFQGKDSPFIFGGTYIFVFRLKGSIMVVNPVMPQVIGKSFLYFRDVKGKLYFAEFGQVAIEKGSGWVEYYWPRAGELEPVQKVSYIKLCRYKDETYVVGCGIYNPSTEELNLLLDNMP
jgi:cytochrome c